MNSGCTHTHTHIHTHVHAHACMHAINTKFSVVLIKCRFGQVLDTPFIVLFLIYNIILIPLSSIILRKSYVVDRALNPRANSSSTGSRHNHLFQYLIILVLLCTSQCTLVSGC